MADIDSKVHVRSEQAADFKALVQGKDAAGSPDTNAVMAIQGVPGGSPIAATVEVDPNQVPFGYERLVGEAEVPNIASNSDAEVVAVTFTQDGFIVGTHFSASGRAKFDLMQGATFGAATVLAGAMPQQFLPAGGANGSFKPVMPVPVAAGTTVYLRGRNRDTLGAQDLAGMIEAYQLAP